MIAQLKDFIHNWLATNKQLLPAACPPSSPLSPVPSAWPTGLDVPPPLLRISLWQLAQRPKASWPLLIQESSAASKYIELLGPLDWQHFPPRHGGMVRRGPKPSPDAPVVAAFLVKLDKGLKSMRELREYLVEQPALTWVLGFPLVPSQHFSYGFDVEQSLPTYRHMSRLLRNLPNAQMHFLLKSTVHLLDLELPEELAFGDKISLDTKHIIAWVCENNPKEHIRGGRFHKERQPKGDKDCKVGFKANDNHSYKPQEQVDGTQGASSSLDSQPGTPPVAPVTSSDSTACAAEAVEATPTTQGLPASGTLPKAKNGQYYWGYASGVVATKVDDWCEVVLAEMTQTFNHADESYFFPLMAQTELNLGRKPKSGALDAAYDTFYVHEYFTLAGGFAAVPWADRHDHKKSFSPDGLPLCQAGLAMPLKGRVQKKSHCLVPHEVGRYVCPLLFPQITGLECPVNHKNWQRTGNEKGCITTLPTSVGTRTRHELDRESPPFKELYDQRTAVERINSQAVALDIERPHLRNQRSITNQNTLLYVLINLRALLRVKEKKALMQRKS